MKKKTSSIFFGFLLSIFLSLSIVSAAQSFDADPQSMSDSLLTGQSGSQTFTLNNTGDENINLSITPQDLTSGSSTISVNATPNSITDLAPGAETTVTLEYEAGSVTGTFSGSVFIENSDNATINSNLDMTLTVTSGNPSIDIEDISSTISFNMEEDDDDVSKTIVLVNDGNVDLTNVQLEFSDLDADSSSSDNIDNSDIDVSSDNFNLDIDDDRRITITIDPSNPDVDSYDGTLTITSDEGLEEEYDIRLTVGADYQIDFVYASYDVDRDGVLLIRAEEGDTQSAEFRIDNEGDLDATGISFVLDDDLKEQFTGDEISMDRVTFSPQNIDIDEGDREEIDIRVDIPDGQPSGTYITTIKMEDINGDDVDSEDPARDSITLKVKVIGDIYIQSPIEYEDEVEPGDTLDVDVTVVNNEATIVRGIKVTGILYNVDFGRSDITESSSTFTLSGNDEKTQTLRFNIPEDAEDGSHDLEIRVTYDDKVLTEIEQVNVERPDFNVVIESFSINPRTAKCEEQLFTNIKYKNLGKFDRNIKVSASIINTNIEESTNTYELSVNEIDQQNFALDISSLEPGTYTVEHKISYNGIFEKEESTLEVLECSDTAPGIDIDIDTDNGENVTINQTDTFNIFGKDVEKNTVYLSSGLVFILVLIVISLFLL